MKALETSGISRERMLYLNFEDERLDGLSSSELSLIPDVFYRARPELRDEECFFFDGVQNVRGWEKFVRRLVDQENAHLCVTGSRNRFPRSANLRA